MIKDVGRRLFVTIILSSVILGGMSISIANLPSTPKEVNKIKH